MSAFKRIPDLQPTKGESSLAGAAFLLLHLVALLAVVVEFSWWYVAVAAALYLVRMWGVTAGYHRYFSHRAFKTGRLFQFVLAFVAQSSIQKGALWWASHHRHHHKHSDDPQDVHSPRQRGLWWSHMGWIMANDYDETVWANVRDLAKFPELIVLNRLHFVPGALLGVALYAIGGLPLFVWGFAVSTVVLWHGTFLVNSLAHVVGRRRYATTDDSKNSLAIALVTLGEGWHNNHHHYQSSARQGFFWWEIDVSYYSLKALEKLGVVWDLREPPASAKYAHLEPAKAARETVEA